MSVQDTNLVDAIGIEKDSGHAILTITDHLEWDGESHLILLQEKINAYLRFIESGEIFESYTKAKGRKFCISLVCLYPPDDEALAFFDSVKALAASADIDFRFKQSHFNSPG